MVKGTYTASTNFRQSKGEPMKDKLGRNTVCLPIKEVVASQRQDRKSVVTNFKSKSTTHAPHISERKHCKI